MKERCALKRQSGENVQGLDDESSIADVAMEVAARNPIRPVQYGGSSSSWEARPEPSRRREAEEQLGGDVVKARLQDPQGVVRAAEQARLQPREELGAALDSICKHVKELGALHVAESDVGEIFLPGRSANLGSAFSELPGCSCGLAVWMGFGFGSWSTGVLEDVTCRTSRVGDWIASESKTFTLDQRLT